MKTGSMFVDPTRECLQANHLRSAFWINVLNTGGIVMAWLCYGGEEIGDLVKIKDILKKER